MYLEREGILFCLVGPAGGGKTTIARKLLDDARLIDHRAGSLSVSISVTSRQPRPQEVDGKSYIFVSRQDFETKIAAGEFFEWEENHGNYYGTLKSTVDQALKSGSDLLLVVDIKGAQNFKKAYPANTVICFIVPPSFQTLYRRLVTRGHAGAEELAVRINTAREEYATLQKLYQEKGMVDYLLVNDEFDKTYQIMLSVLNSERTRLGRVKKNVLDVICEVKYEK